MIGWVVLFCAHSKGNVTDVKRVMDFCDVCVGWSDSNGSNRASTLLIDACFWCP